MKTIYLNENEFEYNSMKELKKECEKYDIKIGNNVKIDDFVKRSVKVLDKVKVK